MALYFLQLIVVTVWSDATGVCISATYSAVFWVSFEVLYAFAWLVFFACWCALLPMAYCSGHHHDVSLLLNPLSLLLHNANVLIMEAELIFSDWSMRLEHFPFCLMFGMVYVVFSWWLHSKSGHWIYFLLDYDRVGVLGFVTLMVCLALFYWLGIFSASLVK